MIRFHNPIHRHYLIAVAVCLALFAAVAVIDDMLTMVFLIICIAIAGLISVLVSGKCQHCGFAIPHTRFSAQVLDFPTHCVQCREAFSEQAKE